jgi:Ca-activated chloride channel family protein
LVFATAEMKTEARQFIDRLVAIGLTNIDVALREAVEKQYTDNVKSAIVFITDGQPTWGETNTDSILAHINRENTKGVRVFPIGIGNDLEVTLLEQIAQQTGGTLTLVSSSDSIALTVHTLVKRLFSPAVTNLTVDYGQLFPLDLYPSPIPTAFGGEQVIQTGRFQHAGTGNVRLTGTVQNEPFQLQDSLTLTDTSRSMIAVARYWGAQKILYLLGLIKQLGEVRELLDQVVALSIRYGVLTPYTAFLVVEPGQGTVIGVEEEEESIRDFALLQNFPNPFNPSTTIRYAVPGMRNGELVSVSLVIYDILGQEIRTLVHEMQSSGMYTAVWDGTDNSGRQVSSGMYIYRLTAGSYSNSRRMVLMK